MAKVERLPNFVLASVAIGGLVLGGAVVAEQSGVFAGSGGDDEGGSRVVAPLEAAEPTLTLTPLPTETPVPTLTPTQEVLLPTLTPTPKPIFVPPTEGRVPLINSPILPTATARPLPTETPVFLERYMDDRADALFASVNKYRSENGKGQLLLNNSLKSAAREYARLLAKTPDWRGHTGPDGSTPPSRVEKAGYVNWKKIAENIYYNYAPEERLLFSGLEHH